MKRKTNLMLISVFLFGFILLVGCSDDDPVTPDPPSEGTIVVNPDPNSLLAPWTLEAPDKATLTGSGDSTMTSMDLGEYTIDWGYVGGWSRPPDSTQTLLAGSTVTFDVVYSRPLPTTPDIMMDNFKYIYEDMDFERFESLLHVDFRMLLLQETFDAWEGSVNPLTEIYFDWNGIIGMHSNIFEGFPGVDEIGLAIPPIDSISFAALDKESTWEPVEESEEYFGDYDAYFARYSMLVYFENPNQQRYEVDQSVSFYVIQGTDGLWTMLGIRLFSPTIATEQVSYDMLLSYYR